MSTTTTRYTQPRRARNRASFVRHGLLALLFALGIYVILSPLEQATASASSSEYTQDQLDAFKMLNEIRAKVGVAPLKLSKEITQAATNHAKYYNMHERNKEVSLGAHNEEEGKAGFTGVGVFNRMKAAGWNPPRSYQAAGEVMHFGQESSSEAMQGWLDTAYHRDIVLSPAYDEIGIALVDGTAVVNVGGSQAPAPLPNGVAVYPYQGMTNAPVGFYGNEIPNPLNQFDVKYSGSIISATVIGELDWHEVTITDESGNSIPYFEEISRERTLFLYPKNILQGNHTYRVDLAFRANGSSETKRMTWSFKTGKGRQLYSIEGPLRELVINEGEELPLKVTGLYDDGTSEQLTGNVRYVSSNQAGLKPVSPTSFKGVKAGSYTIKAQAGSITSDPIQVKVLPRLKTKSYPPFYTSKSESTVTEAQFWTMFLQHYQINIEAYAPAKKKHSADAAYQIATLRNIPLLGVKDIPARDKPITRMKAAEVIAAADGVHYIKNHAVWYVLGMGYMKGVTDSSINGFEQEGTMTRGEVIQLLTELKPKLSSLRARPAQQTSTDALPPLPELETYKKPETLKDYMLIATYNPDRTLTVEGKFSILAGQQTTLMVQTGSKKPEQIEDVTVSVDSEGKFKVNSGPYTPESLNIYLKTPGTLYWIAVKENGMNVSEYTYRPKK